jgi:CBS domain-containing protein
VTPDAPLAAAIEMMTREDLNQLPVVSDGRVEGILSRSKILRLLQNVIELNG